MTTLSIDYAQKLRSIRKTERLTQAKFAELTNLSLSTVKAYESGQQMARAEVMEKVLQNELFEKYTLWLIRDKTAPAAGQVAPALSLNGSTGTAAKARQDATGEEKVVKSSRSVRRIG